MVRKETILITSMILLITYTMSLSLVSQAHPQNQTLKTISSTGNVKIQATPGIGVYETADGTTPLTSLQWGTLEPGQSQTISSFIKNEGNVPLTISVETENWSPDLARTYLTLNWNCNTQPLNAGETAQLTLTLEVDPNTTGITNFGFDITIIGS